MLTLALFLALAPIPAPAPAYVVEVVEQGPGRLAVVGQAIITGPRECTTSEQLACDSTCRDIAFGKQGVVLSAKCKVNTSLYALSIGDVWYEDRSCVCTIGSSSTTAVGRGY